MMAPRCLRTHALIARRDLDDAERMQLEYHLGTCSTCADDRRRLALVRETLEAAAGEPTQARARAIANALEHAGRPASPQPAASRRVVWIGAAALAAGIVAVVLLRSAGTTAIAPIAPGTAAGDELAVRVRGTTAEEAPPTLTTAVTRTTLELGRARVVLEPGTRFSWFPHRATFVVRGGTATFDVVPATHSPFRVDAARFVVEVVGTRFIVGDTTVRVQHGTVRVLARDHTVLDASLTAGEEWSLRGPEAPARAPRFVEILERARAALAIGDARAARAALTTMIAATPPAIHEAAARNLLAECALVEGDRAGAVRLYLEVARSFPRLAAGENALYAAARLEARSGHREALRRLLDEYRTRYPRGRFHDDVVRQLRNLEEKP